MEVKKIFEEAYRAGTKNPTGDGGVRYSLVGRAADGSGIYKTNYPPNTPKSVKQADLISLIQNVWSNEPITLKIVENGEYKDIVAKFNPELELRSDLAKIAFGNRKGTAAEQRMTLDLASHLYQIATEAKYNYSKDAIPKPNNPAHDGVTKYHYFLTNLVYMSYDGEYIPCHMNIDVKQNADGEWFYSFAIEKGSAPQTLLAAVTENSATLPTDRIDEFDPNVNTQFSLGIGDQAYMDAVSRGDTATAPKLVDQSAMQTGNWLTKAGLTVKSMMKNPQYWMSFSRTLGSDYKEAKELGVSDAAATVGAILKSTVNAGIEIGFDGGSGIQGLDDALKNGGKPFYEWVESTLEEGGEEMLQKFVGEAIDKVGYGSDKEILNPIEYAREGALGVISGAALGGGQTVVQSGVNAYNEHQQNKLTDVEQAVVDKVYKDLISEAEKEGKITEREKSKIYDAVLEQMEKGYISTETIEGVLGDRSAYDNLVKESEEFDKLYNTPGGQLSKAQQDRLAQLEEKNKKSPYKALLETEKGKLSQGVQDMVKGSRLAESYAERGRRGEAFQADVSQYAENQRATVQAAIDSGVLNNTNRSHELVDFVAKLAADKGLTFNFADNAKLKETGFALEDVTVNGFVSGSGVTVNVQSAKALNAVVGHEITHVLEGTELYDALAQSITEYAKAKGEYQSRYDSLAKLYAGIEGANVEAELVADLVGDYLFTDKAFVQKLSTENRSLFKKIFDEVKYLCKAVTAGSKEARQLLEVKKIFEEVYRQDAKKPTGDGGVKFDFGVTQADIDTYVDDAYAKKNSQDYKKYAEVSERLLNDVQAEINIAGYSHALRDNDIRHIRNSHGENTQEKYPVTKQDIKNIPWIIENYDKVYTIKRKDGRTGIMYVKVNDQGTVYYLEQVTTKYGNEPLLINKQMIKTGIGDIPDLPGLVDAITKKQSETEFLNDLKKAQQVYAQSVYQSHSDNKIPQPGTDVKMQFSLSSAENVKAAEQHFGTTYKISEAGYLLTDGRLLDFSGRHEGGPGGYRTVDHRDITDALGDDYGDDSYSGGMIRFMSEGNIRLSPESGGINLSVKPNKAQLSALDRYISNFRGEVILDIDDTNGNTVVSVEYPKRTYSKRIINDINAYFDNGTIPEPPSSISQFLSLTEQKKQAQGGADDLFPLPWQIKGQDVAFAPIREDVVAGRNAASEGELVSEGKVLAENAGIRSQLRNNQEKLDAMQLVAEIQVPAGYAQLDIAGKKNWVAEKLRPTGYKVERKGFGVIDFAKKRLKSAFNYFDKNSVEEVAFEAIPYVLENGIEVANRSDHKDRNYGTVTIAAPITINGKRGNMAVVVKRTSGNYYKVHRILTPDGSVFHLPEMTNEAESTPAGESPKIGSLATPKDSASTVSIPEQEAVVNPDDSTGAAPSGFDPVSHLQYEYGSLPEGEHPVREDSLPQSTNGEDRVSLSARTAKGAEARGFLYIAKNYIINPNV